MMEAKINLHKWSQFDIVKNGASLSAIQDVINQGTLSIHHRDRGGLLLTHLSSAYDRADFLEWLIVSKGMDLDSVDGKGRTALDAANSTKAGLTTKWIMEWKAKGLISRFMRHNYHRLLVTRRQQRLVGASIIIQAHYRGHSVRKHYSGTLLHRLEESHRFSVVWGWVQSVPEDSQTLGWSNIREKVSDMAHTEEFVYDDSHFDDTDEQLSKALEGALHIRDVECSSPSRSKMNDIESLIDQPLDPEGGLKTMDRSDNAQASWLNFQVTSYVVKFLKRGDPKYMSFFVRRMQQLAQGERSRILQKRLKGSQSTIYETIDKSNMITSNQLSLIVHMTPFFLRKNRAFAYYGRKRVAIWAKHKEVSRLMRLIGDSKSRSARQQMPESLVSDIQNDFSMPPAAHRKEVLLDVFGNVPMKVYDVGLHQIDEITLQDWAPKLHLITDEEHDIVEAEGTVLVLGRSGTRKTVCICNRMEYNRQKYGQGTFTQLFVARSKRLCRYVEIGAGAHKQSSFVTFDELIHNIETKLGDGKRSFVPSKRIDFQRFKRDFCSDRLFNDKEVGALVIWTVIRTFIKGSLEAFKSADRILSKHDFLRVETLGKNRCRVPAHHREFIYSEFLKYEQTKESLGLWDDSDRIHHLLLKLEASKNVAAFDQVRSSALMWMRFRITHNWSAWFFSRLAGREVCSWQAIRLKAIKEIRSCGYSLNSGSNSRCNVVPQKPKIVNVNFRSHAGVLDTAGAFLDFLFKYFPGSAKQLRKDRGLFQGSRPGVLHRVDEHQFKLLLSDKLKGTVVLCHDGSVHYWWGVLGNYRLVYGIKEAKGLEFKSVMLLNFFYELPSSLHKPWRNLLLGREGLDFELKHPLMGMQLKLLYTGIT
ncbi:hypothetical protein ACHAWF_015406, partial [Thalassiosira exigua]